MKTGTIINRTLAQLNKQANKQGAESLHYDFRANHMELSNITQFSIQCMCKRDSIHSSLTCP